MIRKSKYGPWNNLSVADFRAFTERIDSLDAAKALCDDVCASAQRVADDLLFAPETDALRHPGKPAWRRMATSAKIYLDKKRSIAVSRVLCLGGAAPADILQDVTRTSSEKKSERRQMGAQGVLDHVRGIVADLASTDPIVSDDDDRAECVLCEKVVAVGDPLSDHDEACTWRRAGEEIERFPTRVADPEPVRERVVRKEEQRVRRENSAANVQKILGAKIEKEHAKHVAHAERMEEQNRNLRRFLRLAIQLLVQGGKMDDARDAGIDPGFLTPEFYTEKSKFLEKDRDNAEGTVGR